LKEDTAFSFLIAMLKSGPSFVIGGKTNSTAHTKRNKFTLSTLYKGTSCSLHRGDAPAVQIFFFRE